MRRSLYFTAAREVTVRQEEVPEPRPEEVQVRSSMSAISAGTEMLFYRGQVDEGVPLDTAIPSLQEGLHHPFKYGYSTVGTVERGGAEVPRGWKGRKVFSLHSHESVFNVPMPEVMPVPRGIGDEDAVFLPAMETALSLVMDAAPLVGERVVVLGQGTVGLLTTAVLGRMLLSRLVTADLYPLRREHSMRLGADVSVDPRTDLSALMDASGLGGTPADLVIELSGNPLALELATHLVGLEGRIVIGSWYGNKVLNCRLGDDLHRKRLRIISSQVSTLGGALTPRWTKERRLGVAWKLIQQVRPSQLITHRFRIEDAPSAYQMLDRDTGEAVQAILTYPEG
jgi:threonine dehydrogenase-like Zn-dependent dehydrogenase